ncbi:hypothetical protein [Streptomyces sp900105755]|uniref:Uncharacterized protein n=1 Tax=Streptomyces sp. 900105755 TaxID=3154389 RepID=A0ABV1TXW0_9ACTN
MIPGDRASAGQLGLFEQDLAPLEWVPLDFRYRFRCSDEDCPTHDMGLKDWVAALPRTFMLLGLFCPKANIVQYVQEGR